MDRKTLANAAADAVFTEESAATRRILEMCSHELHKDNAALLKSIQTHDIERECEQRGLMCVGICPGCYLPIDDLRDGRINHADDCWYANGKEMSSV